MEKMTEGQSPVVIFAADDNWGLSLCHLFKKVLDPRGCLWYKCNRLPKTAGTRKGVRRVKARRLPRRCQPFETIFMCWDSVRDHGAFYFSAQMRGNRR